MFPPHPFSGVSCPRFRISQITRRLHGLCEIQEWGRQRREAYPVCFRASAIRDNLFRRLCHSPFICPAVCCLPICPSLLGLYIVVGYFAAKSAVRFNRFCFSPVDAFLFFRLYNLLFPETVVVAVCPYGYVLPAESASLFFVAAFHFIVQSLFRYVEYCMLHSSASFFKRNCRGFFRCVDRRLTIFSECTMLAV